MTLTVSYKELLKNPTSWKHNVMLIIRDIDERINQLSDINLLKQVFSTIDHDHDTRYASKTHNHDDKYSHLTHKHNEYLTENDTIQNSTHLDNHPSSYFATYNHLHPFMPYIASFTIQNDLLEDTIPVQLEFNTTPDKILVLDSNQITVENCTDQTAVITTHFKEPQNGVTYHLLYFTEKTSTSDLLDANITTEDVTANQGDTVTLYSIVRDKNNNNINHGTTTYDLSGGTT